jgi:hypothetical protein
VRSELVVFDGCAPGTEHRCAIVMWNVDNPHKPRAIEKLVHITNRPWAYWTKGSLDIDAQTEEILAIERDLGGPQI